MDKPGAAARITRLSHVFPLRSYGALRARLLYVVPGYSRFLGRSECTCGTRAQQEDCSGIQTHSLSTLVCLEVQALPLSHLLLLLTVHPHRNKATVTTDTRDYSHCGQTDRRQTRGTRAKGNFLLSERCACK